MKNALIDRAKTALVVIDLQKGVVGRQTAPHAAASVVKNGAALAAAFRINGMPVFLVRVAFSPDGKDMLRPLVDTPWPAQTPPPDWTDIVPEMGPEPGDFVITKRQWGAFYGTELDLEFRRRGITTVDPVRHLDEHRRGKHRPVRLRIRVQSGFRGRCHGRPCRRKSTR